MTVGTKVSLWYGKTTGTVTKVASGGKKLFVTRDDGSHSVWVKAKDAVVVAA